MPSYDYYKTTDRVLIINWSGLGKPAKRQKAFGGYIASKNFEKYDDGVYRVPKNVTLDELHTMLENVIRPSDQAILTYPHGDKSDGASVMRIRVYGKTTATV